MAKPRGDIGEYKYNEFGVCTNPDTFLECDGQLIGYKIFIAQHRMGWTSGHYCRNNLPGVVHISESHAPSEASGIHTTKELALLAVVEKALRYFKDWRSNELNKLN
ncbi:MAG: hypothetical protein QM791_06100, partial [Ferruginibacter sp.]